MSTNGRILGPNASAADARERHAAHPATFDVPAPEDLAALQVGDFAKIMVEFDPDKTTSSVDSLARRDFERRIGSAPGAIDCERFWIEITGVTGNGDSAEFSGTVANDLLYTRNHGLRYGDPVVVGPENLLSLDPRPATDPKP